MAKHSVTIDDGLYEEISEYCKINGKKIVDFCNAALKKAVAVEKFGDIPFGVVDDFFVEPVDEKSLENSVKIPKTDIAVPPMAPQEPVRSKEIISEPVKETPIKPQTNKRRL